LNFSQGTFGWFGHTSENRSRSCIEHDQYAQLQDYRLQAMDHATPLMSFVYIPCTAKQYQK